MSNEEQTQIFRGDNAPPEMAIAETGGPAPRKRPAAPSDQRSLHDAEGPVDARHAHDAEGPALQRQMHDASHAPTVPPQGQAQNFHGDEAPQPEAGTVTLNSFGEPVEPDPVSDAVPEAKAEAPQPDADLTFKVEEDATPWALSIHLEARIASLTESTAKVNEQLGSLEDSIKRLAKRIGK